MDAIQHLMFGQPRGGELWSWSGDNILLKFGHFREDFGINWYGDVLLREEIVRWVNNGTIRLGPRSHVWRSGRWQDVLLQRRGNELRLLRHETGFLGLAHVEESERGFFRETEAPRSVNKSYSALGLKLIISENVKGVPPEQIGLEILTGNEHTNTTSGTSRGGMKSKNRRSRFGVTVEVKSSAVACISLHWKLKMAIKDDVQLLTIEMLGQTSGLIEIAGKAIPQ